MKVIAITGKNGSGKGTVVELLQKQYPEFEHISGRNVVLQHAKECGVDVSSREKIDKFSEEKNREGWSVIQHFIDTHTNSDKTYIVESMRRVAEINKLKTAKVDMILLAIDADIKTRYERVTGRGSFTDTGGFDLFVENDKKQSESLEDNQMNIDRCIALADYKIDNTHDFESLEKQVQNFVEKFPDFFAKQLV